MKDRMNWFKHSYTFSDSEDIASLIEEYGLEIYGRILVLMEFLGRNQNRVDMSNERKLSGLKLKLKFKTETNLRNFINTILDTDYFEMDNNSLLSTIVEYDREHFAKISKINTLNALQRSDRSANIKRPLNDRSQYTIQDNTIQNNTTPHHTSPNNTEQETTKPTSPLADTINSITSDLTKLSNNRSSVVGESNQVKRNRELNEFFNVHPDATKEEFIQEKNRLLLKYPDIN